MAVPLKNLFYLRVFANPCAVCLRQKVNGRSLLNKKLAPLPTRKSIKFGTFPKLSFETNPLLKVTSDIGNLKINPYLFIKE